VIIRRGRNADKNQKVNIHAFRGRGIPDLELPLKDGIN